jgi:hypothetical protein
MEAEVVYVVAVADVSMDRAAYIQGSQKVKIKMEVADSSKTAVNMYQSTLKKANLLILGL